MHQSHTSSAATRFPCSALQTILCCSPTVYKLPSSICTDVHSHHVRVQVAKAGSLQVTQGASGDQKPHAFGWRDAMDVLVKWRQLSEPNDQVQFPQHLELQMVVPFCHLPPCVGPLAVSARPGSCCEGASRDVTHL